MDKEFDRHQADEPSVRFVLRSLLHIAETYTLGIGNIDKIEIVTLGKNMRLNGIGVGKTNFQKIGKR